MPTTSNFGWTTPADTDLVKDGAAAIRTLGNGIDTSLLDLKGGTTGQILSKASNTDLDYTWITNDVGDITAVTAGTGISGGGTSGAVTITNSMATEITAKGDLIVGTGSGTFDNLAAGTNGHILTADSSVSPTGLKWAAPAAPSFSGVYLQKSANQTLSNNTATLLTFDVETIDTNAYHDDTTNTDRITIPSGKSGKYFIGATVCFDGNNANSRWFYIKKNGTTIGETASLNFGNNNTLILKMMVVDLVATDYISITAQQNSGGNLAIRSNAAEIDSTSFFAYLIGA